MDLLTNAIESIQAGVEDYKTGTRPRLLSAVRNIHAGILLLYKEALNRFSPPGSGDALIMSKIMPALDKNRKVTFVGAGRKTVDVQEIRDRFNALGIKTTWKRFDRISETRNDLEHRHPRIDKKGLEGVIADSFLIIRDFVSDELEDNPRDLLGEDAWQTMLEVADVYEKERAESIRLIDEAKWASAALKRGVGDLTCSNCGSDLLKPSDQSGGEIILECTSCGSTHGPWEYADRAIKSALRDGAYRAIKDGDESPYAFCPECGKEAYVMEEDQCAACQNSAVRDCKCCGSRIPAEELLSSPLCSHCEYVVNKDD